MTGGRSSWKSFVLVAMPLAITVGLAGVLVLPGLDEAASMDTRMRELDELEREAVRVAGLVKQFETGGKSQVLALEEWRKNRIPEDEDDRNRFDLLRRIEARCGVEIVRCKQSSRRPMDDQEELHKKWQLMMKEHEEHGSEPLMQWRGFDVVSMKVVVRGTFLRLVSFTEELQFGDRLFAFREVHLERKKDPILELTLQLEAVLESPGSREGSEMNR